ncbi:pyrroloquinoline quinone biosynthesis protein D [Roseivivax lentus]|uniref:Pyrroloquinoline quinone biosynthesis protein D n=1 Tax=Roseivivax lentus TaxID=633194 RepID=A0A1N7PY76_9RHOB|nr:pyrroloquinoline quinone biosynthesis peptide chaperone PqqD [Roseivivax lentus]SIT15495.1 pyrroloquinoline quinone biosynthesis protein D [Roseivivax lentus]
MSLSADTVPALPRGVRLHHDHVRDRWVLLAPERTISLDPVGHAILSEVDGTTPFGGIVDTLAAKYSAPAAQIATDAGEFLQGLADRRIVDLRP